MSDRSRRAVLGTSGVALATALAGCNDILGGGDGDDGGGDTPTDTEEDADGTETEAGGTETETAEESVSTPRQQQTPVGGPASVDKWLRETTVGGAADNYDGEFEDMTDEDVVGIDVAAEGNGGYLAFDPPAVVVSAGTDIHWQWTSHDDQAHNVDANPDEQMNTSDYEFSSGPPQQGGDVMFARTLEKEGVALYHCDEHLADGMKGGVVVEE